ncbi:TPA: hypothetical protein ACF5BZ_001152 [Vibrio parahaemolyticus]|uniref:hypothetical protein n=1 Tax=Vibrio parahaemolyticus TaxID=670 RepID=UPI001124615A|nr:hypothetical protein [Vibrio parahaemolyticus]EGR3238606.1 hypothetical protein [Vibrio parahaemolyticus]EGS6496988.1 hypothetical protein [Vibrio parahaemolyticus]EHR6734606.1 hypothetical protein [Vibrio parahaemolyticus]ELF4876687.1 hypothetical protein [Vibrio parahaemolyticus]MCX8878118.1 hypothetical protein [Vibrio parahaemolyticus]
MKKLKRNAEKFDVLELFAEMATEHGYNFTDQADQKDFLHRVKVSIEESKKSQTMIFGKRTESLFAYVAGALGKVSLIKQEDFGDIYYSGEELLAPDYRLTFDDNEQMLVEVKNCHHKQPTNKYSINKGYYSKLKTYADLNGLPLRFAVYFSAWNHWTLLGIDAFDEHPNSYTIDFGRALAMSEMYLLGDCQVGVAPDLELHLLADPQEEVPVDEEGEAKFIIKDVKIYCDGEEVTDEEEKKIAFYLMCHGDWVESEQEALFQNGKVCGTKFVYSPQEQTEPNFALIGRLSQMVTNGFREHTIKDGNVVAMKLGINPSSFGILIPPDYKGKQLPLWRFVIHPNPDFEGIIDKETVQ